MSRSIDLGLMTQLVSVSTDPLGLVANIYAAANPGTTMPKEPMVLRQRLREDCSSKILLAKACGVLGLTTSQQQREAFRERFGQPAEVAA